MFRSAVSSVAVVGLALAASLSVAFWMNRVTGADQAQAATPVFAAPPSPARGEPAQVLKGADGHFWADARIDGRAVPVMIDTGASVVALTLDDARRLGVTPNEADFVQVVRTASGPAPAAAVRLASVTVAGAEVREVEALVLKDGLPHSLLGMSYLGRLSGFEATPSALTLRP
ncbi:MAG: TIGR02281 family clan AA aspartic protease [Brevundimonas sp.]|uniref:TIGR02281 family clan AA aspartic protease n=1 Tax=Brevundimonas sp. TaxID=1871086 RepID=UPI0025C0E97D|nr:TIGR02281 family clan AA aspartic protease [Brevundimonas sp.]MBX3477437.1 TIGR02281 family clan AA aspartic protease [Brevundimonas sp.]